MVTNANFAALPPVPGTVTLGGEVLDISPLRVGELPAFAKAVLPIAQHIGAKPDWLYLVSEHGEAVIDAVAIASRRPRAWVAGLGLDEAIVLAEAIFEANADFFIHRLVPEVMRASARINEVMLGLTGSSSSSGPGIAIQTS